MAFALMATCTIAVVSSFPLRKKKDAIFYYLTTKSEKRFTITFCFLKCSRETLPVEHTTKNFTSHLIGLILLSFVKINLAFLPVLPMTLSAK